MGNEGWIVGGVLVGVMTVFVMKEGRGSVVYTQYPLHRHRHGR